MSDLSIENAQTCRSNIEWETQITGSEGDKYTLRWGFVLGRGSRRAQYGWSCSCHSFRQRGACTHITHVVNNDRRCAWNEGLDPGLKANDDGTCPHCGGPTEVISIGV